VLQDATNCGIVTLRLVVSNHQKGAKMTGITIKYKDLTVEISWVVIALAMLTVTNEIWYT